MTLSELIAALERAEASQQDELVRRALRFAVAHGWVTAAACERAMRMCDAEAYESAALALVPEGHNALIYTTGAARVWPIEGRRSYDLSYGRTPALALWVAVLKARGGEG